MTNKEIIEKLIYGETVSIVDKLQFTQIKKELREIKNNCNIVSKQMKENL